MDEINITVPVSCSMTGTGMNTHNAEIINGTSNSSIGETVLKAFCNDNNGFAIYAVGYTDDTDGNNVLASSTLGSTYDIETGTATSGNTSNWAMKLSTITSPTPTYPITIQNSFDSFHIVPDDYALVAKRTASTDVGTNAEGSTLKTTYQVYISKTQPADTYTGQVKYVLVHPSSVDANALKDAITVVFDGNGLTFPNGTTSNTVKYANVCEPGEIGYVGSNYEEAMTSNITTGGTQSGGYTDHESSYQPVTLTGADKVKVVVDYAITGDTISMIVAKGNWDGSSFLEDYKEFYSESNASGIKTYIFDGDTVTLYFNSWNTPESGYDKGFYARVYPVYDTEQPGTTQEELPSSNCSVQSISGTYTETTNWKGKWLLDGSSDIYENENDLSSYLSHNYDLIKGSTITLLASNPYTLIYNGNGASNEFGMGVQRKFDRDYGYVLEELYDGYNITLLAPNYKRAGYGFIGWSTDANAASHLSTATLHGPSETVTVNQALLSLANSSREVTLYATWLAASGNIQNWSGCSSLSTGGVVALTDVRDNDTYAVAKLADGNCWMIENLRLGGTNSMELTIANTQSAGTLTGATSVWGNTDTSQSLYADNKLSPLAVLEDGEIDNYAFGNLYSWAAAINTTDDIVGSDDGNALTSICPAGWKLPEASSYRHLRDIFGLLDSSTLSAAFRSYPYNYIYSGYVGTNGYYANYSNPGGLIGEYQTSSFSTRDSKPFIIRPGSAGIPSDAGSYIRQGAAIRCLASSGT